MQLSSKLTTSLTHCRSLYPSLLLTFQLSKPYLSFYRTNALITNFHQPRSTLLMLVSAFYGGEPDELAKVYRHALENDFRFLSYGDSSIYADAEFFSSANF